MPKNPSGHTPEWRGEVKILDGKYWREIKVVVHAVYYPVAVQRAAQQAKAALKKNTRCHEVVVKLRRTPVLQHPKQEDDHDRLHAGEDEVTS